MVLRGVCVSCPSRTSSRWCCRCAWCGFTFFWLLLFFGWLVLAYYCIHLLSFLCGFHSFLLNFQKCFFHHAVSLSLVYAYVRACNQCVTNSATVCSTWKWSDIWLRSKPWPRIEIRPMSGSTSGFEGQYLKGFVNRAALRFQTLCQQRLLCDKLNNLEGCKGWSFCAWCFFFTGIEILQLHVTDSSKWLGLQKHSRNSKLTRI